MHYSVGVLPLLDFKEHTMSLNYDLTKCENLRFKDESLTEEERDAAWWWTEAVIFRTMAVGIGEITAENAIEFWTRNMIYSLLTHDPRLSYELILEHVGLTTNVPKESDTKWRKRILDGKTMELRRDLRDRLVREAKQKQEA